MPSTVAAPFPPLNFKRRSEVVTHRDRERGQVNPRVSVHGQLLGDHDGEDTLSRVHRQHRQPDCLSQVLDCVHRARVAAPDRANIKTGHRLARYVGSRNRPQREGAQ